MSEKIYEMLDNFNFFEKLNSIMMNNKYDIEQIKFNHKLILENDRCNMELINRLKNNHKCIIIIIGIFTIINFTILIINTYYLFR